MRYKPGDTKKRKAFLIIPKTIGDESRWLEYAEWEEKCHAHWYYGWEWVPTRWLKKDLTKESD